MFLTHVHARWPSRGHNWAYKLPCKPCSAQLLKNECQLQLVRDSFNHKDTLCSTEASNSPATAVWRVIPKEAQFSPQLTLLHAPEKAAVTALNCCITCGFLHKGGSVWPAVTAWNKLLLAQGLSPGRCRATEEGRTSPRKLHKRALHQASGSLSCCLTQCRAGRLLSRTSAWLRQQKHHQADWESFWANYHTGIQRHQCKGTAWCLK